MDALVAKLYGPRDVRFETETLPPVGENDILIKILTVGLCHSELPQYIGIGAAIPSKFGFRHAVDQAPYPMGMGHEVVAEVVSIGKNIRRFRAGDKISGRMPGCLRTYAVVPNAETYTSNAMLFKIPDQIQNYRDCISEPLECVVNIVKASACKYGERIAVIGCGFMGLLTIAGLKHSSALELTAIDVVPSKLDLALELGATDQVLLTREIDIETAAFQQTDGNFYDVVVEFSGRLGGLDEALKIVRPSHRGSWHTAPFDGNAKIILPSVYSAEDKFPVSLGLNMMLKTPVMHVVHPMYDIDVVKNHVLAIEAFARGELPIDRMITHHLPFSEVRQGYEWLSKAPEGYIKGVIDFD